MSHASRLVRSLHRLPISPDLVAASDGERLEHWAFRKAFPEFRCSKQDGLAFWVDAVGYSSAVAYGVLVPLFLAPLMQ